MNYEDYSMLNRSLGLLGERLMQNKALNQRKEQMDVENGQQQQMLDERAQQYQGQLSAGADKLQMDLQDHAQKSAQTMFNIISKNVADGTIDADAGTKAIKAAAQKIAQSSPAMANDPMVAMIMDPNFALQNPAPAEVSGGSDEMSMPDTSTTEPMSKEVKLPNGKTISVVYNPKSGAFHIPEENAPDEDTITSETTTDEAGKVTGKKQTVRTKVPRAASGSEPAAAPANPAQRKSGTVYKTPKGNFTWTGTGWLPAQ